MKRTIKTIGIVVIMGFMLIGAYWLGTTQAGTATASQTIPEVQQTVSIYDRYIVLDAAVFHDNYVDMRKVVGFESSDNGLQLYFEDGSGYYWER